PEATEVKKLHSLDPSILSWLKERAEKEQDFRHLAYSNKFEISERRSKRESTNSILGPDNLFHTGYRLWDCVFYFIAGRPQRAGLRFWRSNSYPCPGSTRDKEVKKKCRQRLF